MKRSNNAEGGSADEKGRSASDKEKTKLRERKRRAITTKIFHGLRKHGGYNLPPRADINDVLRHLAGEAGWVIESDGTTYRTKPINSRRDVKSPLSKGEEQGPVVHRCPACGYCPPGPTTASSSFGIGGVGGGDCSTTASPRQTNFIQHTSPSSSDAAAAASGRRFDVAASSSNNRMAVPAPERDLSLALSTGDEVAAYLLGGTGTRQLNSAYYSAQHGVSGGALVMISGQHQKAYLQEARASNQNTPIGSPQR
ncbi:BES1/BZR1 homolog protein 4-like [Aristolochia californica]|uniref:BES1/BZR1 homolog protein 4-like n=1 Tax=Aristolochia californica TaxID=171875 RepID=UPI0035E240D0